MSTGESHNQDITRAKKTLLIFLLDHSDSMKHPWYSDGSKSISRAEGLAEIVNETLSSILDIGSKPEGYRDYFDVSLIGYGSNVESAFVGSLAGKDIATSEELFHSQTTTEAGYKPYVTPNSSKSTTNMCAALSHVAEILTDWCQKNPDNYPPTVIHVTDGESTDGDPTGAAEVVKSIKTNDGEVMLWNIHISPQNKDKIMIPDAGTVIPDTNGTILMKASSRIPKSSIRFEGLDGKYAFAYNASPRELKTALKVGTPMPLG